MKRINNRRLTLMNEVAKLNKESGYINVVIPTVEIKSLLDEVIFYRTKNRLLYNLLKQMKAGKKHTPKQLKLISEFVLGKI